PRCRSPHLPDSAERLQGGRLLRRPQQDYPAATVVEYCSAVLTKFENARKQEEAREFKFSIPDPWSRQLFIALCRRYGIKPFRYRRMHHQTVIVRAPGSFVQKTLWPEYEELSAALTMHLADITTKIIREEVHEATQDVEEVNDTRSLR
ncbi:hypothetical protein OSJ57_25290, partial [Sphingomonas sp. HH69]